MNATLIWGTRIVILALLAYSVAVYFEQRTRLVTGRVRFFLTLGISLDIIATALMVTGSPNSPFTLHGLLGYSSLLGMLVDAGLIWRHYLREGSDSPIPRRLHLYTRLAYFWWVAAFITGALLVLIK